MKGILSDEHFNHYALLVGGVYLLSTESISPADLRKAEMLLAHFVEMFDVYYGMINFVKYFCDTTLNYTFAGPM